MATTAYLTSPAFARHDTGSSHPERAARLLAIERRLEASGLLAELAVEQAPDATREQLLAVHDAAHVDRVEAAIARGARVLDEGDTRVSSESFRAALAAAGGAVRAVDLVLDGAADHAFIGARPPGHHAERGEAMGFCLFNNAAVAAAHLRRDRGVARVAILDWDVHHGNGTQHLFERDPTVFYASLHQWPLYPGTGSAKERGIGAGEGATLNCPQPPGAGDREWLAALEDEILPAFEAFDPEFIVVSAGFDAHARDPLAQTRLSTAAFGQMTSAVLDLARRRCRGRLVSLLEGGYDLDALAESVEAHVAGLVSSRAG
ncbi:MAG TPA: histone deacetylase [Planctomycetota bacterium]|nr:histone deacetylase [Planctomycetota bacterium]